MLSYIRRLIGINGDVNRRRGVSAWEQGILDACAPFTMTSPERLLAVIDATSYLTKRGTPGAFVECGVWRGGSIMAMLLTLQRLGDRSRDVFLFDTFEGMTRPGAHDTSDLEPPASRTWNDAVAAGQKPWTTWFNQETFSLDQVRATLRRTEYPADRIHFVAGDVAVTVPEHAPAQIALLRLDTDWYDSTAHELKHLYPRLARGGVLIVDDYGHWQGCRRAVDEYFSGSGAEPVLLSRIDYTGRMAIKA